VVVLSQLVDAQHSTSGLQLRDHPSISAQERLSLGTLIGGEAGSFGVGGERFESMDEPPRLQFLHARHLHEWCLVGQLGIDFGEVEILLLAIR